MLKERQAYEMQLILELKESASTALALISQLESAPEASDEALDAYASLMAQTLQLKLDAESILELNEEIMQLELETVA